MIKECGAAAIKYVDLIRSNLRRIKKRTGLYSSPEEYKYAIKELETKCDIKIPELVKDDLLLDYEYYLKKYERAKDPEKKEKFLEGMEEATEKFVDWIERYLRERCL